MKRKTQPEISEDGQQALEQYWQALQHFEDISLVTIRNYLSDQRPPSGRPCSPYQMCSERSGFTSILSQKLDRVRSQE